jgi:hypothetical protein
MIGWLAGNVPRLAEIRQPLVDALAEAGQRAPNSKRAGKRAADGPLGPASRRGVEQCKDALRHAVELNSIADDDTLVVMSDPSAALPCRCRRRRAARLRHRPRSSRRSLRLCGCLRLCSRTSRVAHTSRATRRACSSTALRARS